MLFTSKRLFDLSSELETGFTVKLNMDLLTEHPIGKLSHWLLTHTPFNDRSPDEAGLVRLRQLLLDAFSRSANHNIRPVFRSLPEPTR